MASMHTGSSGTLGKVPCGFWIRIPPEQTANALCSTLSRLSTGEGIWTHLLELSVASSKCFQSFDMEKLFQFSIPKDLDTVPL